jgi:hypothetical protein
MDRAGLSPLPVAYQREPGRLERPRECEMTRRKALGEAQWLSTGSTSALFRELTQHHRVARTSAGRRRLRLFACSCCRRFWHLFTDQDARQAVEVAERFADGQAGLDELVAAGRSAGDAERRAMNRILELTGGRAWLGPQVPPGLKAAQHAGGTAAAATAAAATVSLGVAAERAALECVLAAGVGRDRWDDGRPVQHAVEAMQCDLLRDIFGNPFRPTTLDSARLTWNDSAVARLAQAAYEERQMPAGTLDNARLAVLADALEEAGCTNGDILGHLRGPGPHVRGCFALDALLGKE